MSSAADAKSLQRLRKQAPDRRDRILDEAERLFAEHGYHGAALAGIARAAGLGNAGLIHHFPDKARLYGAVLDRVAADLDARLAAALARAGGPHARLSAFVDVQVAWACERPLACRLIQRELIDNRERIATARLLPLARFVATGREIVAQAQAAGLVTAGPADAVLSLVIGALAYGAIVRPTFAQMLRARVLKDDRAWLTTLGRQLMALLAPQAASARSQGGTGPKRRARKSMKARTLAGGRRSGG